MKLRRILAALAAAILLAAALSACTAPAAPADTQPAAQAEDAQEAEAAEPKAEAVEPAEEENAEPSGDKVTITFMHIFPEYTEQFEKVAKDFEEKTGVHVDIQIITWDVLTETLTTNIAAGTMPDVVSCWSTTMGTYHTLDAVLDVTDYLEANNGEWKNNLIHGTLDAGAVDGRYYAIPFRTIGTCLVYNKAMFEELGYEIPATEEDLIKIMDDSLEKQPDVLPIMASGNPNGFQMYNILANFAHQELYKSGKIMTSEYLTGHMTDVHEEYTTAAAKFRDWMDKGYVDANSLALTREEGQENFFNQRSLFIFCNVNELATFEAGCSAQGFDFGYCPFPAQEGVPNILNQGPDGFMAYSKTEHPDEAAAFLEYLTSDEVATMFGNDTLSIVCNKNVVYDDAYMNEISWVFDNTSSYGISYDYNTGNLGTDLSVECSEFMSDSSYTPEDLGAEIERMMADTLAENYTE